MDKEDELIRAMLSSNSSRKTAPAGFTETVMRQVQALEQRRIYRRLVLTIVLRTTVVTFLLLLLVVPIVLRGIHIDASWTNIFAPRINIFAPRTNIDVLRRSIGAAGSWAVGLVNNAYYLLLPLLVLLFGRKRLAIK